MQASGRTFCFRSHVCSAVNSIYFLESHYQRQHEHNLMELLIYPLAQAEMMIGQAAQPFRFTFIFSFRGNDNF